jgi:hypothetical protein
MPHPMPIAFPRTRFRIRLEGAETQPLKHQICQNGQASW